MHLPFIQPAEQSREIVEEFRGYNHNLRIGDNEFYEETNITGDLYPVLAPRAKKAAEISSTGRVQGMLSKGGLYYVKGETLYCGDTATPVTGLTETPKQLVSMGAYIVIFPDNAYYNTQDADDRGFFGSDAAYLIKAGGGAGTVFGNNYLTVAETITGKEISISDNIGSEYTADDIKTYYDYMELADGLPVYVYHGGEYKANVLTAIESDGNGGYKAVLSSNATVTIGDRIYAQPTYIIELQLCLEDGSPIDVRYLTPTTPEDPNDNDYWLKFDNHASVASQLNKYSATASMWVEVTNVYTAITIKSTPVGGVSLPAFGSMEDLAKSGDGIMLRLLDWDHESPGSGYSKLDYYLGDNLFNRYLEVKKVSGGTTADVAGTIVVNGIFKPETQTATHPYNCTKIISGGQHTLRFKIQNRPPKMDFVTESNNRLWGCRYGTNNDGELVNEIYASKLGDFRNWNYFQGTSMDSYTASCGTDGEFTGAITHLNYPLFFKENYLHKVFGNYPANFQITSSPCRGVAKGAGRSLAIVNESVYYKSRGGVCVYDGSLPYEVSGALGNVRYTGHDGTGEPLADYPLIYGAVGGAAKNKYYISMKSEATGDWHLFVYDTVLGIWHREDNTRATGFSFVGSTLYYSDDNKIVKYDSGEGGTFSERIPWSVTTGFLGLSLPWKKYITAITFKMSLEIGASASFSIQYDGAGQYQHITTVYGSKLQSFTVPIKPRRCDYFRIRIDGTGDAKLYNIIKTIEAGSEK